MFNIEFIALPGARFVDAQSVTEHGWVTTMYENAVEAFDLSGDEAQLWEDLRSLCFEPSEIQWHVDHPGQRMKRGYW